MGEASCHHVPVIPGGHHLTPHRQHGGGGPSRRILVVDDSRVMRRMLGRVLSRAGYTVDEAANGKEAIERALSARPHVILMDVTMPVMNGWEATHRLSNHPAVSHIPVVILSCNVQQSDADYAAACGAHSYLTKPIRNEVLLDHLARVAREQRLETKRGLADCRVMVLSDEGDGRLELAASLRQVGCAIVHAGGPGEAVGRGQDCAPDLVLIDLDAPSFDGHLAARHLRALPALHDVPIIGVSERPYRANVARAVAAGVSDYVARPLDDHTLMARAVQYLVDRMLDGAAGRRPAHLQQAA